MPKADHLANSHQGIHKDCHGRFMVLFSNGSWHYIDLESNESEGGFATSEEAYDAASSYGE